MLKKIISKLNLNINSMIKYGSIATSTMIFIIYLFGIDDAMLAFPIVLTAIALSFENINIRTANKLFKLITFDCSLLTLSYIASCNPLLGIIINFTTIFFIAFIFTVRFNPKIYKPFIMFYIFASFSLNSKSAYLERTLSVIIGVTFVVLILKITNRFKMKNFLKETIYVPLSLISSELNSIIESSFENTIYNNISFELRNLCYKAYITKYKNHSVTNLGKIRYNLFLSFERLNIYIKDNWIKLKEYDLDFINNLNKLFINILDIIDESKDINECIKIINIFIKNNKNIKYTEIIIILTNIANTLKFGLSLKKKDLNKDFKEWTRFDLFNSKMYFKENFKLGNIRFNFALRVSFILTLTIFLGHVYSFYKFIWVAITVMSVMQPYYEETISKGKERLIGNLIGITFLFTLLTFINNDYIAIVVLILSLYLTYGFKEYYKLSLFTSMASISVASLSVDLNTIALHRITFVLLGLIFTFLGNKFLFPYNLLNGSVKLIKKILNYDSILINECIKENFNQYKIRDLVMHIYLSSNKLALRNIQLNNEYISEFIDINNHFIINLSFWRLYL